MTIVRPNPLIALTPLTVVGGSQVSRADVVEPSLATPTARPRRDRRTVMLEQHPTHETSIAHLRIHLALVVQASDDTEGNNLTLNGRLLLSAANNDAGKGSDAWTIDPVRFALLQAAQLAGHSNMQFAPSLGEENR